MMLTSDYCWHVGDEEGVSPGHFCFAQQLVHCRKRVVLRRAYADRGAFSLNDGYSQKEKRKMADALMRPP